MCCFAQKVEFVGNTQIFSRLSGNGTQFLVYQMSYRSQGPNAMILPLPVRLPAQEKDVRFIALDQYPEFFNDLANGFPLIDRSWVKSPMITSRAAPDAAPLAVVEVGDFVASFVPTLDDFDRLDPRFVIPKSSWEKIPEYTDFSFAVFQLKSLDASIHPIAFEFPTRWSDRHFFPTVHIHDGEVHSREHFDHMLYLQEPSWDRIVGKYAGHNRRDPATQFVRSQKVASHYCKIGKAQGILAPEALIHRQSLQGMLPNQDTLAHPLGPTQANIGWMPPAAMAGALASLGLGWIIHRRNHLQKS
ncbi:MAG: hypothetical protein U0905_11080 [Pirellulales bacterium]